MSETDEVRCVRSLYEAFACKDEETLRRLLHPQVEWNQCAGFPGGGSHRGAEAVLADVFGKFKDEWDGWRAIVREALGCGSKVVVLGHYEGTHRRTGKSMRSVFAHVYTVTEGKIIRFEQVADTVPLAEAMRAE